MTPVDRKAAYHMLLGMVEGDKPKAGSFSVVAALFSVDKSTISRLWAKVRANRQALLDNHVGDGEPIIDDSIYSNETSKRRKGT